ncbi:MAG TPA: hypothetical protein VM425_19770 [Myxococcota bacterium]|nr:hypothetical protein [Myxococcota bacterium]
MATALLLNSIAMIFASYRFIKAKLVLWKVAVPILIVATALSPLGVVLLGIAAKMIFNLVA